jgi:hypothetical protein
MTEFLFVKNGEPKIAKNLKSSSQELRLGLKAPSSIIETTMTINSVLFHFG